MPRANHAGSCALTDTACRTRGALVALWRRCSVHCLSSATMQAHVVLRKPYALGKRPRGWLARVRGEARSRNGRPGIAYLERGDPVQGPLLQHTPTQAKGQCCLVPWADWDRACLERRQALGPGEVVVWHRLSAGVLEPRSLEPDALGEGMELVERVGGHVTAAGPSAPARISEQVVYVHAHETLSSSSRDSARAVSAPQRTSALRASARSSSETSGL